MHRFLLALLTLALLAPVTPLRSEGLGGVIVQEKHGVFRVMARFVVPESPEAVLALLADYEAIPSYLPDVKTSVVRSRGDGRALVEQEAERRFMMFSKRVHLLLDIRESPDALIFSDTSGVSFARYEGSWRVFPTASGTEIAYQLEAKPSFDVPKFVLMRLLRRDAASLIERIRAEVMSRNASPR